LLKVYKHLPLTNSNTATTGTKVTRQDYMNNFDSLLERMAAVKDRMYCESKRVGDLVDSLEAAEKKMNARRDERSQIDVDPKVVILSQHKRNLK